MSIVSFVCVGISSAIAGGLITYLAPIWWAIFKQHFPVTASWLVSEEAIVETKMDDIFIKEMADIRFEFGALQKSVLGLATTEILDLKNRVTTLESGQAKAVTPVA